MALSDVSATDLAFTEQCEPFLQWARARYPDAPATLEDVLATTTAPLRPICVGRLDRLTSTELAQIKREFDAGPGVVHVLPASFDGEAANGRHALIALADQLRTVVDLGFPVDHPMEGHPEALSRFGPPDGTLKLYNLPVEPGGQRYREQAETNEMFDAHNDGLGYAGLIKNSILVLDRPPISGGYTYFQNLVRLAPALAASDPDGYRALFLPDAITALRPRGKGAIEVTSPAFFIGRGGVPQVFFRVTTGEYQITWRAHPDVQRAAALLNRLTEPFGPSSTFVHLMRSGDAVIIHNRQVVHGRTPFIDPSDGLGRVLARKWFVPTQEDAVYRHVPGMEVAEPWASMFDRFQGTALVGEWHYNQSTQRNEQVP